MFGCFVVCCLMLFDVLWPLFAVLGNDDGDIVVAAAVAVFAVVAVVVCRCWSLFVVVFFVFIGRCLSLFCRDFFL